MAGTYPSTLVLELNRLANGGSYGGDPSKYLDADGAAAKWCNTPGLALNGSLNTKAGIARNQWLDLDGVCNALAGTSGLSAVNALISIAS